MDPITTRAAVAVEAATHATAELRRRFRAPALDVSLKGPDDPVTAADLASEAAILGPLQERFPQDHFVSEEQGQRTGSSDYTWLVDPLCGTLSYALGLELFGFSIALLEESRLVFGLLGLPFQGEMVYGDVRRGVVGNGHPWRLPERPRYGMGLTLCVDSPGPRALPGLVKALARLPSTVTQAVVYASGAYSLAQLVLGRVDGYLIWGAGREHVAAGSAVATFLGLQVARPDGAAVDWTADRVDLLIAAPATHERLSALLR